MYNVVCPWRSAGRGRFAHCTKRRAGSGGCGYSRMMAAPDLGEAHLPRILVVDDNPAIHRDFRLALANECHNAELQIPVELASPVTHKLRRAKPAYELEHALSGVEGIEKVINTLAARRPFQLAFI